MYLHQISYVSQLGGCLIICETQSYDFGHGGGKVFLDYLH